MRCLYCGKELALLKRWTGGGEFCSDAHRQQYQEEYNQLALTRLLQAKPPGAPNAKPDAKADAKAEPKAEPKPGKSNAPAKSAPKEMPALAARVATPEPEPVVAVASEPEPELEPLAVEPEPEPVAIEPEPEPEPDPAPLYGFLVELPVPVLAQVAAMAGSANGFECHVAPAIPAATFEEHHMQLVAAGPVEAGPRGDPRVRSRQTDGRGRPERSRRFCVAGHH